MRSYKVARRSFLRGCGASTLLLPLLRNIEARAQDGTPAPLRFLVIHQPLGTFLDQWRPNASATTTSFTLPQISAPFEPLRSRMVMIDGLNIVTASRDSEESGGDKTHEGGIVGVMTGVPTLGRIGQQDHPAGGASIDQIFLDQSPQLGGPATAAPTPFGSLQLAADTRSDRDEISPRVLSYRPPTDDPNIDRARQPLHPVTQPLNVYEFLFANSAGGEENAEALLAQQRSVLDFMRSDLNRLGTLVPASERDKIDSFASSIQQLEASLQQRLGGGLACTRPEAPPTFEETGRDFEGQLGGIDYYVPGQPDQHPHEDVGRLQLSMIRAAFACDLVRVATFMWSPGTNHVVFPGQFNGTNLGQQSSPHHPPSHTTDAATSAWLTQVNRWYAEQTSLALQEFAAETDVDGTSLLDNTVVAVVSEVARAYDHDFRNVPYLVFGGARTGVQGGTFLKVTDGPLPAQTGGTGNRPTNDVWLALAPAFDVPLTELGAPGMYTGALPGLVG